MSDICHYLPDTSGAFTLLTASDANVKDLPVDKRVHVEKLNVTENFWTRRKQRRGAARLLSNLDQTNRVDLVHLHGIWLDICKDTVGWARSNDTCLVISPHGMLEPWALNHKKLKKQIAMALYQRRDLLAARAFHACSQLEAESIRLAGFKQPIAVIPNGVQLPALDQPSINSPRSSNQHTALFLSRINPKKGLPMLLDAWKRVAPKSWRLVIAGNDDSNHTPLLQRKIIELGLTDSVEVVGPLFGEDKKMAYLNADVFLLPSYSENFGIVVTEALGYQVPVLTTTGCPWKELETEGCGWWVDPTQEAIEAGLLRVFKTDDCELRVMGARGRALVQQRYLWPKIAENMYAFYEWLIHGGTKPEFVV